MNIRPVLFIGGLIFFLILELIIPYRESSVSKLKRWLNNLGLAVFNSIILNLIFSAAIVSTAVYTQTHNIGSLNMVQAPSWLTILLPVVFMGTLTKNVDQNSIKIDVGAYRQPENLNLHPILLMPFTKPIK
jgi:hypothetical protein